MNRNELELFRAVDAINQFVKTHRCSPKELEIICGERLYTLFKMCRDSFNTNSVTFCGAKVVLDTRENGFTIKYKRDNLDDILNKLICGNQEFNDRSIKNVIFNDPATIVYWTDGSKTVVKASGEPFDKEKGLAMAIIKKMCGNDGSFNEIFKKWCN